MKLVLLRLLAIGSAGFVGAVSRWGVGLLFGRMLTRFPFGTLVINVTGSFFLGWFSTFVAGRNMSDTTRIAIATGFVGAYTTFSTFMYESNQLAERGAELAALANLIGSVVLGIIAVRLGIAVARWN